MTLRWTSHLNLKGGGNKSMTIKRGMSENVYGMVLQHLNDMVKARLLEL
jgi:hypothetical protein